MKKSIRFTKTNGKRYFFTKTKPYLLILLLIMACSLDDGMNATDSKSDLIEIASYRIDGVPEPSGLSLHINGKSLWTVSDQTAKVYQISLSGQLLKTLPYIGQDLEGVSQSPLDGTLWVAEERKRELVQMDSLGNEISRHKISVETNDINSGLEGLAANPRYRRFFVLNEKNPALFMDVSANASVQYSKKIQYVNDCSGIYAEPSGAFLWMVSDESRMIVKCDSLGNKLGTFRIDVDKAEGIAVSTADNLIYIVSDSRQKLYVYQMQ